MSWIALIWGSLAVAAPCTFTSDAERVHRLDCSEPGVWTVRCPVPQDPGDRLRLHLSIPQRRIEATARSVQAHQGEVAYDVVGPSGGGGFMIQAAGAGLVPGQPVGMAQLCPSVQPGVAVGSPPAEIALEVSLTRHHQTGTASLSAGAAGKGLPIYDGGEVVASGSIPLVQRPVEEVPLLAAALPLLQDDEVRGTLQVRSGEDWVRLGWRGSLRQLPVSTGDLVVLSVALDPSEVAGALQPRGEPLAALEAELVRWLAEDPGSLLGLALWRRSGLESDRAPVRFGARTVGSTAGRWAEGEGWGIWLGAFGEQLRVVIARRAAPLDGAAEAAIEQAVLAEP